MLDVQTKKKLFAERLAHSAPVRDISMFDSSQDVFVSCGYDCYINVFDLRRRLKVQQHKQDHPMSTVCVSPCGTFCVAGNLKGDIISYDFRNMKEPIDTKRAHDSAVVRVAFVPSVSSNSEMTMDHIVSSSSLELTPSTRSSTSHRNSGMNSFYKFVDVCHYNNAAAPEENTPKPNRNSWLDLVPAKKFHDFSMESMAETPSRLSIGGNNSSMIGSRLSAPLRPSPNKFAIDADVPSECSVDIEQTISENKSTMKEKPVIESKRRRMTDVNALEGIQEEAGNEQHTVSNNKLWLHKVDHKEFANAFAAFVKNMPTDADNGAAEATDQHKPAKSYRRTHIDYEEGLQIVSTTTKHIQITNIQFIYSL